MSLLLFQCGEKVFDIDDDDIVQVHFKDLPPEVSSYIDSNINKIVRSNGSGYYEICYSTDSTTTFSCGRSGASNNWINEVNSNYHHFFVDGIHWRMKGNKGHPFILHKGFLYFGDLNIYKDDYKERPYFKVKVSIEKENG